MRETGLKVAIRKLNYTVIFKPAEERGYVAEVPALPGCFTQGETLKEAKKMAKDAIYGYLKTLIESGESIPEDYSPLQEKITLEINVMQDGLKTANI